MLRLTPAEAHAQDVKNATERAHNAHEITLAFRAARERRALAYTQIEKEPYSAAAAAAFAQLTAADMQLDAAIHTEQTAVKALMVLRETGRKVAA